MIPELLAITPGDGRDLEPWIDALADAGLPALLLREPQAHPEQVAAWLDRATRQVPLVLLHLKSAGALELLRSLPEQPVHLPEGRPLAHYRGRFIGTSRHALAGVDGALAQGADLVLLSPVWAPASKPDDHRSTLGLEPFLAIATDRPVLALGGVTPERHHALRQAGAAGSAVLGDLFQQPDPAAAAVRLRAYLH